MLMLSRVPYWARVTGDSLKPSKELRVGEGGGVGVYEGYERRQGGRPEVGQLLGLPLMLVVKAKSTA